jgi:hypothetical protein
MSDTLNFAQMYKNSAGDEAVPAGQYDVQVTKATHKMTTTGKPMLQLVAKTVGGPSAGKGLFDNMVITSDNEKAMYYFFKDLDAHGVGSDFFATNPNLDQICAALVGTNAAWDVSVQASGPYAGRNEIKGKSKSMAGGGGVVATPAPAQPAPAVPAQPPAAPVAPTPVAQAPAPAVAPAADGQPGF